MSDNIDVQVGISGNSQIVNISVAASESLRVSDRKSVFQ
jgi:hypothetical protein